MEDGLLILILIVGGFFLYCIWNINHVNEARHRENIRDEIIRGLVENDVAHRTNAGFGGCVMPIVFMIIVILLLSMLLGEPHPY
jgi:hypothetical protein